MTTTLILLGAGAWILISIPVALILGQVIRYRDQGGPQ